MTITNFENTDRITQVYNEENGDWVDVKFKDIKKDNLFRYLEKDRSLYVRFDGVSEFKAAENTQVNMGGVLTLSIYI